jgi:hypothetical protein
LELITFERHQVEAVMCGVRSVEFVHAQMMIQVGGSELASFTGERKRRQ